ncbi:MAG: TatD family hydrolase [Spirochaetes bacterium]|nr:TatD family hydrolase [Spirochaetota bacterium]
MKTMLTDAHCHPFDLYSYFPQAEEEREFFDVVAAASACDLDEFAYNEELSKKRAAENLAPLLLCFAVHPQLPAVKTTNGEPLTNDELNNYLETLYNLAAAGRLSAVGECGFDLFNASFRETEAVQDRIFSVHLETALRYDLPAVLHIRRAMHKIFANVKNLAKCRAVVFHSWPGTFDEGMSLLKHKVNAYFSFGNTIRNGHKHAMHCCARFPAERFLTETDAPFQPLRGQNFSCWTDLPHIIEKAASLRNVPAKELETQIENNFKKVFKTSNREQENKITSL